MPKITIQLDQQILDWLSHRFPNDRDKLLTEIIHNFHAAHANDIDAEEMTFQQVFDHILYPRT